jgi:hypothetical protein
MAVIAHGMKINSSDPPLMAIRLGGLSKLTEFRI